MVKSRPYDGAKRLLDILGAFTALVLTSPIIAVVSVLVGVRLGRPVLFVQDRPGRDGRVFQMYKFRTMQSTDTALGLVTDAERLTSFGRTLRSTSLDELPTLMNVMRGEMSLVGPRPLLVRYLDRYTVEQARRHEVRPGVTGLAQVMGRNALSWEEKFALDVEYVNNVSFCLDLKIAAMTVMTVFRRRGIAADGSATMPEFDEVEE